MRRIMILFGLFDLGIVFTYATHIPANIRDLGHQPWLCGTCLLMLASLVVSAYGLVRGRQWALVLNYVQFPFRVALAFLSFGWLAQLVLPQNPSIQLHEAVWVSAVALEGVRLGISIMLHRGDRSQRHDPPPWTSRVPSI